MSLIPYREDQVIVDDPESRSLMVLDTMAGSLKWYQQVKDIRTNIETEDSEVLSELNSIACFRCPGCGTEVDPTVSLISASGISSDDKSASSKNFIPDFSMSKTYFKLLENSHKRYALKDSTNEFEPSTESSHKENSGSFIPSHLFIPGYFRKFFNIIGLLGTGARGSVYKVVHRIGDIELGVFALKKIPIGNDVTWFEKCVREVKALTSLTHESANLITYNHVWLEMDASCGFIRTRDGIQSASEDDIPCIFILQQYCDGGNLEAAILNDVFHKYPELNSTEERKEMFRLKRKMKKNFKGSQKGLSSFQIIKIIKNIASGLNELHSIGLIHRDLKPSNCLLMKKFKSIENEDEQSNLNFPLVVIGDLGESQLNGEFRAATGATGTLEFTAPEVIICKNLNKSKAQVDDYNEYSLASDIYSLGMIMYFVIFGSLPFNSSLGISDLKSEIKNYSFDSQKLIEKHRAMNLKPIHPALFELMLSLLSANPKMRPTAEVVENILDTLSTSLLSESNIDQKELEEIEEVKEDDLQSTNDNHSTVKAKSTTKEKSQSKLPIQIYDYNDNIVSRRKNNLKLNLTRFLLLLAELMMSLFILIYSPLGSTKSYLGFLLLGAGLTTNTSNHHLIAIPMIVLAIMTTSSDYFRLLMSIVRLI